MIQIKKIAITCLVLAVADGIPNKLPLGQCKITDANCKKMMYRNMYRQLIEGDSERNIPKADPMLMPHIVSILPNAVKFSLEEVVVTGFKDCDFEEMKTHMEGKFYSTLNVTCDLEISGLTKVDIPKVVMEELGGEDVTTDITGMGKAKLTTLRLHLLLHVPFVLEWMNNDVYLHAKNLSINHDSNDTVVLEYIEDFNVGNKGNSEKIVNYLKEKVTEMDLLAPITAEILKFFEAFMEKFVATIPAKMLFSGDSASYA